MIWSDREWITAVISRGRGKWTPLVTARERERLQRTWLSPSGLTDVEIMSYDYSHGGGVFQIPVKPQDSIEMDSASPSRHSRGISELHPLNQVLGKVGTIVSDVPDTTGLPSLPLLTYEKNKVPRCCGISHR